MALGKSCRGSPARPCRSGRRASAGPARPAGGPACPAGGSESLDGRKTMASLFASGREHLAAPFSFHARAKTVCLVATAHFRLKRAFRQRTLPLGANNWTDSKRLV